MYELRRALFDPAKETVSASVHRMVERTGTKGLKYGPAIIIVRGPLMEKDDIDKTAEKYCKMLNEGVLNESEIRHRTMSLKMALMRLLDYGRIPKHKLLEMLQ